jgi:hypothetical protein
VDAHPLQSGPERVCKSCLVPSLPSAGKDTNVRRAYLMMWTRISWAFLVPEKTKMWVLVVHILPSDVDAHPLPSELARVRKDCLVPSLASARKDINARTHYPQFIHTTCALLATSGSICDSADHRRAILLEYLKCCCLITFAQYKLWGSMARNDYWVLVRTVHM